ncbi:MAG: glucose-6-phosphate dehydrogenase, partial [Armatimonadetes bacterium]|nr:glucose-6-phosphate dehydrogenase [Armatimonadota bacterium]
SGDLTRRKLLPALYDQFVERRLPPGFTIIGCARTDMTDDSFRAKMREEVGKYARNVPLHTATWESFAEGLFYVDTEYDDLGALSENLRGIAINRNQATNWLLYMTTPPQASLRILHGLWTAGLAAGRPSTIVSPDEEQPTRPGWTRIVVEKPFGRNLENSRNLNHMITQIFKEEQIYRIDHYLGKEAVQNILVFRFANRIFEPVWNNRYIDNVQITVAESLGVEARGGYYETSGALKDMVQNHILQLLALVAMEPPASFNADAVRDEKVKVLRAIRPITAQDAVRAQYAEGWIGGQAVPGYRAEKSVSPTSTTETYVALKMLIDDWRFADVPFYLRTGKRLPKRVSEIAIEFKRVPHMLFKQTPADQVEPNLLVMRIQPDEGISLKFESKVPGQSTRLRSLTMDFHYGTAFGVATPEAYERLLLDCMLGDSTLFSRRDSVEASWIAVQPILDYWKEHPVDALPQYEAGTWGPEEADRLVERDGRRWRRL